MHLAIDDGPESDMRDNDQVTISSVAVSLHSMTCSAMKGDSNNCEEAERTIKAFLTMHSRFDEHANIVEGKKNEAPR